MSDAFDGFVQNQGLVECAARGIFWESEGAGGVSLRIAVDDQGALFGGGERGAEINGGGGFSDATFLIGDCDDSSQRLLPR